MIGYDKKGIGDRYECALRLAQGAWQGNMWSEPFSLQLRCQEESADNAL